MPTPSHNASAGQAAHTPGNWQANADTVWRKIDGRSAEIVCHPINHPQSIADARLIASAPELLVALQSLVSSRQSGDRILGSQWACAVAAIAKATGGAQ